MLIKLETYTAAYLGGRLWKSAAPWTSQYPTRSCRPYRHWSCFPHSQPASTRRQLASDWHQDHSVRRRGVSTLSTPGRPPATTRPGFVRPNSVRRRSLCFSERRTDWRTRGWPLPSSPRSGWGSAPVRGVDCVQGVVGTASDWFDPRFVI